MRKENIKNAAELGMVDGTVRDILYMEERQGFAPFNNPTSFESWNFNSNPQFSLKFYLLHLVQTERKH